MSEWSQMTELDNLSKSETPNLATHHRLACTGSHSSINCDNKQLFRQLLAIYWSISTCTGQTVKSSQIWCLTFAYIVQLCHLRPLRHLYHDFEIQPNAMAIFLMGLIKLRDFPKVANKATKLDFLYRPILVRNHRKTIHFPQKQGHYL